MSTKRTTKKAPKKASKKGAGPNSLVDLTPDELKRLPRPRDGFEAFVGPLLALYEKEYGELAIKSLDATEIEARFRSYEALAPLEASARKHLEMVEETRILHASKVWTGMLDIYAKAQAAARTNVDVARAIGDFEGFMKLGPRKAKTPPGE